MKKLNIAIIGYGRSGCDIHGAFLRTQDNDICNVVAVVENDPARAAAAKEHFGCDTYTSYTELFERKDLDFIVNASYSDLHYPITKDLMEHGFNVLCEKPLCKTPEMVQDLIDTAKKNNVIFTIFHQYRFNDYYIKMYELLEKKVGKMKYKEISKFPSIKKDVAFVVDKNLVSKDIEKVIKSAGGSLLTDIEIFDVYTGSNVVDSKKSIAYSLTFADNKKTLTDEEVNTLMEKVMNNVCNKYGAEIRK